MHKYPSTQIRHESSTPPHTPANPQDAIACARGVLPQAFLDLVEVPPVFEELTEAWHHRVVEPTGPAASMLTCAKQLHMVNFRLWHTEDKARRPDAPDHLIAACKRSIDADNQQRHNQIERLDRLLFAFLYEPGDRPQPEAELHSETPGSLLDRLSIAALKLYHMAHEAEREDATTSHRQHCQQRLAILTEQRHDLWSCLCHLCIDLWTGRKRFKLYRQFKMYNDPELNPEIYRHRTGQ